MADEIKTFDWGDGTKITVKKPDLSKLEGVMCPIDCFPEGEEGTGQVVSSTQPPIKKGLQKKI